MSDPSDTVKSLIEAFPGKVSALELAPPQDAVLVEAAAVREFFEHLKTSEDLKFDHLSSLAGVDAVEHLEVVYHIYSTKTKLALTVKVNLPTENPEINTICDICAGR